MSDTSALDNLRIANQATPAGMAYHAAHHLTEARGLTAVTSLATKQNSVMLDGRPIGRFHPLTKTRRPTPTSSSGRRTLDRKELSGID